jgi:hypothetical protein
VDSSQEEAVGVGLVTGPAAAQARPFQRKITILTCCEFVPQLATQDTPTAHAVPPGATATSSSAVTRSVLGLGVSDHARPFHRRISVLSPSVVVPQPATQ